ncbi:hypothetical protein IM697_19530 [Streptomyces ferrugineus]|uniref:Uncharacterized protein n=1 Tax=Streptomyces ferrugineus TaxID=1413221 RepID=A0A7M2SVL9_9ACTN|nr:hypothetical protein [Streptomyces ferrugineus]QOV40400.1 hypothetical protein IM697_19530 [Streptomyces ferrugineus]
MGGSKIKPDSPERLSGNDTGRDRTGFLGNIVGVTGIIVTVTSSAITIADTWTGVEWRRVFTGLGVFVVAAGIYQLMKAWRNRNVMRIMLAVTAALLGSFLTGLSVGQLSAEGGERGPDGAAGSTSKPQPTSSSESTAPSPSGVESTPPEEPSLLRSTNGNPITWNSGYGIDLDSDDGDWGIGQGEEGRDLYWWGGLNYGLGIASGSQMAIVSGGPDIGKCRNATDLQSAIKKDEIRDGISFCVLSTTENHVAWVTVADFSDSKRKMKLEITVWDAGLTVS